jgi:His/Glu/Gln/Arg/opine family amino acid ABC transporter permease subunit
MEEILKYLPLILRGTLITVSLAVAALLLATFLGGLGAAGKLSRNRLLRILAHAYTSLVRGVPDLVMLLLIYFGGQRAINLTMMALGMDGVDVSTFWAGVIAIGFIYGAYLAETFRGAFLTIPRGQAEAASALGMGPFATLWNVTVPQLVRFALPGYANVFQVLVKSTAVVSIIGLQDLVGMAGDVGKTLHQPFTFYAVAFAIFLGITWVSQRIFYWLERRFALKSHHAV